MIEAKPSGRGKIKICNDGFDNDGDGYTDFPDDPGCANKNDGSELNPLVECDDGSDNDGDDAIDYNDGGCSGPTDTDETDCGDSVCEGGEVCDVCVADCGYCDTCSDTDGGNNIYMFGTTSGYLNGSPYNSSDYCFDSTNIMEYFCSGDYELTDNRSCGLDAYSSENYCYNGSVYRDWRDYWCSSGECGYTDTPTLIEQCDYGCLNATCSPSSDSCNDTDGGFYVLVQGTVSGYENELPYNYTDYCLNTTLVEFYCSGVQWYGSEYDCVSNTTTYCSSGACH
jgi:hypothetical protein